MVFLNIYDTEKPVYAFMASYMGNKIPVRIASSLGDEWGSITTRSLLNDCFSVVFNFTAAFCMEKRSPLPYPEEDAVDFWIGVNLMRLDAETCDD